MAKRRMFSLDIIDTDAFLDLSVSAQNLYFHLGMRADDDGFVASPKRITHMVGCSLDDYRLLIARGYLVSFDSGICLIRDWKANNYLRADRYTPTVHTAELELYRSSGSPAEPQDVLPECIPEPDPDGKPENTPDVARTVSTGKDRIGKDRKGQEREGRCAPTLEEVRAYCRERHSDVDPVRFWEYFDTGGWKDSKGNPVKNWKQKLLTWENHSEGKGGRKRDSRTDHSDSVSKWNITYAVDGTKL